MRSAVRHHLHSPPSLAVIGLVVLVLLAGIVGHLGDGSPASASAYARGDHSRSTDSHEPREQRPSQNPSTRSDDPGHEAGPETGHEAGHDPGDRGTVPRYVEPAGPAIVPKAQLPGGGYRIFGDRRFLVAYYGTAQTGAMGVLGTTDPATMQRRLMRAARPFREPGEHIQPVYELIVTVADRSPGPARDFSHDIPRHLVQRYVRAAHRNGALLLLDIQSGRAPFPAVAKRWTWALRKPWVGLALDPEWRMGPHQVPASVIGSVGAAEVNRTSLWLSRLVEREQLPQKLFVLHQFRLSMLPDIGRIVHRPGLAMVQHADGFGTQRQKLATYRAITRPAQFHQGFKLFYHSDVHRFAPRELRRIHPRVSFVSYQ